MIVQTFGFIFTWAWYIILTALSGDNEYSTLYLVPHRRKYTWMSIYQEVQSQFKWTLDPLKKKKIRWYSNHNSTMSFIVISGEILHSCKWSPPKGSTENNKSPLYNFVDFFSSHYYAFFSMISFRFWPFSNPNVCIYGCLMKNTCVVNYHLTDLGVSKYL